MNEQKDLSNIVADDCVEASLALDAIVERAKAGEDKDVNGLNLLIGGIYLYNDTHRRVMPLFQRVGDV